MALMDRHALASIAFRTVTWPVMVTGGLLMLVGALWLPRAEDVTPPMANPATSYRLVLDTQSEPACYYGSAWNDGDVTLTHDAREGKQVVLTTRYDFADGCTWEATEVLTPSGDGYCYEYTERVVSCRPGAVPALACERAGTVSVLPAR